MAKIHGYVGYVKPVEITPGNFQEEILEKEFFGDDVTTTYRIKTTTNQIDDYDVNRTIKILAAEYMKQNARWIRYVKIDGIKWSVNSWRPTYPNVHLEIGGLYNGG